MLKSADPNNLSLVREIYWFLHFLPGSKTAEVFNNVFKYFFTDFTQNVGESGSVPEASDEVSVYGGVQTDVGPQRRPRQPYLRRHGRHGRRQVQGRPGRVQILEDNM